MSGSRWSVRWALAALLVAGALSSGLLGLAGPAAARTAPVPNGVRLRLGPHTLPGSPRVGQVVLMTGHVRSAAPSVVAIEHRGLGSHPGRWRILSKVRLPAGGGSFRIRWRVPSRLSFHGVDLRLAVLVGRRVDAATIPVAAIVGPATVHCAAAVPPPVDIPPGDGWIEGGAYIEGGPAPGLDECVSDAYTVTARNPATGAAVSQPVAGGRSYTIVVPAGTYTLTSNGCSSPPVSVSPGREVSADVVCAVP